MRNGPVALDDDRRTLSQFDVGSQRQGVAVDVDAVLAVSADVGRDDGEGAGGHGQISPRADM